MVAIINFLRHISREKSGNPKVHTLYKGHKFQFTVPRRRGLTNERAEGGISIEIEWLQLLGSKCLKRIRRLLRVNLNNYCNNY